MWCSLINFNIFVPKGAQRRVKLWRMVVYKCIKFVHILMKIGTINTFWGNLKKIKEKNSELKHLSNL